MLGIASEQNICKFFQAKLDFQVLLRWIVNLTGRTVCLVQRQIGGCYNGRARTGETLLASARPVALKAERQLFPESFTVICSSQVDQIPSSSPDLKHGIFSYYLMRGMEGDADVNRDGRITVGEMHQFDSGLGHQSSSAFPSFKCLERRFCFSQPMLHRKYPAPAANPKFTVTKLPSIC